MKDDWKIIGEDVKIENQYDLNSNDLTGESFASLIWEKTDV